MKLLSILIVANHDPISQQVAEYLLGAGHSVQALEFESYKQARIADNVDFCLNFTANSIDYLPNILISLTINEHTALIKSKLFLDSKTVNLLETQCALNGDENLSLTVTEFIVDTIIYLSMNQDSVLVSENSEYNNSLAEFCAYLASRERLQDFYEQQEHNEQLFAIGNKPKQHKKHQSIIIDSLNLSIEKLEVFTSYMLLLLNARKEAIYTYDLAESHKKPICKYLHLQLNTTYSNWLAQANNTMYDLNDSKYFQGQRRAAILVMYSDQLDIELLLDYPVVIHYAPHSNKLTVHYDSNLYFFASGQSLFIEFITKYADFASNNLDFRRLYSLQHILETEFVNQYRYNSSVLIKQFVQIAEQFPNRAAVVYNKVQLSYADLNGASNQLANYLNIKFNIQRQSIVALCLEKSELMPLAILATLKSGACYAPISPIFPKSRVQYIINELKPNVIITTSKYKHLFTDLNMVVVDEQDTLHDIGATSDKELNIESHPEDLAYIIYTSGTTGTPNGVMLQNNSVLNMVQQQAAQFNLLSNSKNTLWFADYVFDAHVSELFTSILYGHTIHILNEDIRKDLGAIAEYVRVHNIAVATIPPVLLDTSILVPLEVLVIAGDKTGKDICEFYKKNSVKVINGYGPTEISVCSSMGIYDDNPYNIGTPIANMSYYVVDDEQYCLPIGVQGELYISGVGLARGYINNESLTKLKFIQNRFYKTGDLVCQLSSGEYEYVGRVDNQIKIRGFRIEPGEIENAITNYPGISQAVVLKQDKVLAAYYVAKQEIDPDAIAKHLCGILPEYMLPTVYMWLEKIPYTINGKLDKNSLPQPILINSATYVAPVNELQLNMQKIWAKIFDFKPEEVSIHDDFFMIGGDSIKSIQLANSIRKELKVDLNIHDIFTCKTIEAMCSKFAPLTDFNEPTYLSQTPVQQTIANSLQKSFIYHRLQNPDSDAYHMQMIVEYRSIINVELFKRAWQAASDKFACLRLRFIIGDEIFQTIDEGKDVEWYFINQGADSNREQTLESLLQHDRAKLYDFQTGNLARIYFVQHQADLYTCIFSHHHSIIDGWSNFLLFNFVHQTYAELASSALQPFEPDDIYLNTQKFLQEHCNKDLEYWDSKYKELTHRADLGFLLKTDNKNKQDINNYHNVTNLHEQVLNIEGLDYLKLRDISKTYGLTFNSILQFIWHKTLSFCFDSLETVVGTTLSGRHLPISGIEEAVGLLINTLPLIINHGDLQDKPFHIAALEVQMAIQELNAHSLVDVNSINSNKSRLFDTLFVYENLPLKLVNYGNLNPKFIGLRDKTDYPFGVMAMEGISCITITLQYAEEIVAKPRVISLLEVFKTILKQVIHNPNIHCRALTCLPYEQCEGLFAKFNDTAVVYNELLLISDLFHRQVDNYPYNIAITDVALSLNYLQLDNYANQLANYMLQSKIERNSFIIIYMPKSAYSIICMLACLKIGVTYIPIDDKDPLERLNSIVQDSKAKIVFATSNCESAEKMHSNLYIMVDKLLAKSDLPTQRPNIKLDSNDVAYVIYTSGSTGRPKGVMVSHANLLNYILWASNEYVTTERKTIMLHTSLAFDMSVTSVYVPLVTGNSITIIEDDLSPKIFKHILNTLHSSHFLKLTPTHLKILYDYVAEINLHVCNTKIVIGGEALNADLIYAWQQIAPHMQFYNEYGPTEATVACSAYLIPKLEDKDVNVPIGKPISNTQLYVLDHNFQLLPLGAVGELYIGGHGVANGYLYDAAMTNVKFMNIKLNNRATRIYKTGDKARLLENGNIEYLGRIDQQLKINGRRIEVAEIEYVLKQHGDVNEAVVCAKADIDQNIVLTAYIVAGDFAPAPIEIKHYLAKHIPAFMIPTHFIILESLPYTRNGKLDLKALPNPHVSSNNTLDIIQNPLELEISKIWHELFPEHTVSRNDDFFAIGGNSILAIKLMTILNKKFMVDISFRSLFDHSTLAELSALVSTKCHHLDVYS